MVEKIYDTLKGIIFTEFPKNAKGEIIVAGRPVTNWIFGDRGITPAALGVIFRDSSVKVDDQAYSLKKYDYSINVTVYSSSDDAEESERAILEAARMMQAVLLKHRVIWVLDICPFCLKLPLSPLHYVNSGIVTGLSVISTGAGYTSPPNLIFSAPSVTGVGTSLFAQGSALIRNGQVYDAIITYQGVGYTVEPIITVGSGTAQIQAYISDYTQGHMNYLSSYVSEVWTEFNQNWSNFNSTAAPTPFLSGLAAEAMNRLCNDVKYGIARTSIPSIISQRITQGQGDFVDNVRLLYDVNVTQVKPSDDGVNKELNHTASFTISAMEQTKQITFGPDNVPVNAY